MPNPRNKTVSIHLNITTEGKYETTNGRNGRYKERVGNGRDEGEDG